MAEKILQTRIINKHAELGTWELSTLPLKEGEIALAKVMVAQPDGTQAPTYVAKIGLEGKTFAESPMLFAPSSDVHLWAKATSKPTYNATEIKLTTEGAKTVQEEIISLKAAVGDTAAVEEMITAAIEALDKDDTAVANQFVTAVAQADGTISVTRRALEAADIPALGIDKITGLQDALNAKAVESSVAERFTTVNSRLDSGDIKQAIDAAKEAGDNAQDYAEGVEGQLNTYKTNNDARVKAIEDDYTTAAEAGTIAQGKVDTLANGQVKTNKEAIEALDTALDNLAGEGNTSTVKANADAIAQLRADIGNVANVMNFRGVSQSETVGADITDPQNGDVIIFGEAEYVYNGSAWVKFGDASDNATAISELQGRVTNVENDLKAGGATYQSIVAAKTQADKGVQDASAAQAKANANETAIGVINGTGAGSISKAVEDAKTELKGYADTAKSDAVATAKGYTDGEIDKVEETITTLTTTVGNNKTAAENATKKVAEDLAAEISRADAAEKAAAALGQKGIDDAAAALQYAKDLEAGQVNTNKQDIVTLKSDVDSIEANFAKVKTVSGVSTLVVGASEDVIIFDCGGAE